MGLEQLIVHQVVETSNQLDKILREVIESRDEVFRYMNNSEKKVWTEQAPRNKHLEKYQIKVKSLNSLFRV